MVCCGQVTYCSTSAVTQLGNVAMAAVVAVFFFDAEADSMSVFEDRTVSADVVSRDPRSSPSCLWP